MVLESGPASNIDNSPVRGLHLLLHSHLFRLILNEVTHLRCIGRLFSACLRVNNLSFTSFACSILWFRFRIFIQISFCRWRLELIWRINFLLIEGRISLSDHLLSRVDLLFVVNVNETALYSSLFILDCLRLLKWTLGYLTFELRHFINLLRLLTELTKIWMLLSK